MQRGLATKRTGDDDVDGACRDHSLPFRQPESSRPPDWFLVRSAVCGVRCAVCGGSQHFLHRLVVALVGILQLLAAKRFVCLSLLLCLQSAAILPCVISEIDGRSFFC